MSSRPPGDQSITHERNRSAPTVLVTGATDGVGRATALELARRGATVIAHGRSDAKAQSLESALTATEAADFETIIADFTELDEVRDLADHVAFRYDRLDALVNNAGAFFATGELTAEGVERTIAVNHLAPFVLTDRLRDHIEAADGRVVTTTSAIHHRAEFDIADLETTTDYDGMDAYARSKFANVLFTYALAERLDRATANCFHPGFIPSSGLYRNASLPVRLFMAVLSALPSVLTDRFTASTEAGAETAVYLATSGEVADVTGQYFDGTESVESAPETYDEDLQQRLWEWSESVVDDG
ncbi:MAG: SDR family NAD(P)-dependent oxidoreductase [Halobacteriota archaeon]